MRMLAQIVGKEWNRTIVVDNRTGAAGIIAGEYVIRQPADGYTLLAASSTSHTALRALRQDLPYDPMKDLVPATVLVVNPNAMVVNPRTVPARTVSELVAYLKANPKKMSYASTGTGSTGHLAAELFKILTKTEMVHVPYRGNAPALTDLLAGNVDLTIDSMASVGGQVKEGGIRALGVTTAKRSQYAPDLPTIGETVPGFEMQTWIGIVVRAGTPPELIDKINRDFNRALRQPEIQKRLTDLMSETVAKSPRDSKEFLDADVALWERVIKEAKITADQK